MCRITSNLPCLAAMLLAVAAPAAAEAQSRRTRTTTANDDAPQTQLEIQLVTGSGGVNRDAQEWSEVFRDLDVAVRIRRGSSRDEPGVSEKNFGTAVRRVLIVAELDRRGRINLPGRSFSLSDQGKLKEWLTELRTYGAQGSPDGQPAWGLTKAQLETVLTPLKRPLDIDVKDKDLLAAMVLFAPDKTRGDLPIHVTPEAKQIMAQPHTAETFPQSLKGISRGTALSVLLRYYGLCFTPRRTPSGDLELAVMPAEATKSPWNLGWPFPEDRGRDKVAPNLFKTVNVNLVDQPLADVMQAASDSIEIPVLLDYAGMREWGINYPDIRVNYGPKKTTWGLAIKHIAFQSRLRRELYIDEAGKPFVWITPIEFKRKPTAAEKRRN